MTPETAGRDSISYRRRYSWQGYCNFPGDTQRAGLVLPKPVKRRRFGRITIDATPGTPDERDATPILNFAPYTTDRRTVKITNFRSSRAGFCLLVILRQSGSGNFSLQQIVEALDGVVQAGQVAALFSTSFATDSFCLFGGRVSAGASDELSDVQRKPGTHALVGAGSNNLTDVDLDVVRQSRRGLTSGVTVARDDEEDVTPVCVFAASDDDHYVLRYTNFDSWRRTPGFVFALLLAS